MISLYIIVLKMSDINFSFEYNGTKDDAVNQIKDLEKKARKKYPEYDSCWVITWKEYGGLVDARYMGMDITGEFDIVERDANGGDVNVTVTLPMLLTMMKGAIEGRLKSEIQTMIG